MSAFYIVIILFFITIALIYQVYKKSNTNSLDKDDAIKNYIFENKLNNIHNSNRVWEDEWNEIVKKRNVAKKAESEGKLEKALENYFINYNHGSKSSILNVNNYVHDINRIIIIYGKLKREEELIDFLQEVIEKYPKENFARDWITRLTKLNGEKKSISADDQELNKVEKVINFTFIEDIKRLEKSLPEFNFYHDLPEEVSTLRYLREKGIVPSEQSVKYLKLKQSFNNIIARAKVAENENDYTTAITIYKELIKQEVEDRIPYNRLMIVYRELKLKNEEVNIIEYSIEFFNKLREKQLNNVMSLAKKYNKEKFAMNYIKEGKRIQYYGGLFDLFNPYNEVDKWKARLRKLNRN